MNSELIYGKKKDVYQALKQASQRSRCQTSAHCKTDVCILIIQERDGQTIPVEFKGSESCMLDTHIPDAKTAKLAGDHYPKSEDNTHVSIE
jgi:hypothetical protein